jgi:methyl-accepting chemotaxis protein
LREFLKNTICQKLSKTNYFKFGRFSGDRIDQIRIKLIFRNSHKTLLRRKIISLNQLPNNSIGITYEQIMATIHETSIIVKDLAEQSKETKKSIAEYAEQSKESKKEFDKRMSEFTQRSEKTNSESEEQLQKIEKSLQKYIEESRETGKFVERLSILRLF